MTDKWLTIFSTHCYTSFTHLRISFHNYKSFLISTQVRIRVRVVFLMLFPEVRTMSVKQAVAERFQEICAERNIKPNELANRAGITPSSVYSMLDPRRKEVSVNLVKKLCDGLDMTLGEFFSTQKFDELEQEIQ